MGMGMGLSMGFENTWFKYFPIFWVRWTMKIHPVPPEIHIYIDIL